jgi:TolB-like protein/Flp pilus assembly protein TadD
MTSPNKSVFLSYASQDADAARRICGALRAADIEVWFDQSELRGGDAWDASIRNQIKVCALFVPLLSRNTHAREEGYFRLEWKLAVDRSHLMSAARTFLLPVAVDDTPEGDPGIPDRFRDVQWTRLYTGDSLAAFVKRVVRLLADNPAPAQSPAPAATYGQTTQASAPVNWQDSKKKTSVAFKFGIGLGAMAAISVVAGVLYFQRDTPLAIAPSPVAVSSGVAFSPPPHSLAVLPFVNMSGDPKQEYFSDGLSEELLNSLVTIHDLQVAARTSSFSFKGEKIDIADIGRKLNVGAVLEGSVRKDGNHLRITAQLIDAVTGFHLWSQTYNRDLKSVLALQTEIASAVTRALQATLIADAAAKIELGGTRDPNAFDAFLRGERQQYVVKTAAEFKAQLAYFDEAIRLDPKYVNAIVGKSLAWGYYARTIATGNELDRAIRESMAQAQKAVALAPELGSAHAAMGVALAMSFRFADAGREIERAIALAPGDARVLRTYPSVLAALGQGGSALASVQKALALDPVNALSYTTAGYVFSYLHRYREAIEMFDRSYGLDPTVPGITGQRGYVYLHLGDSNAAVASCLIAPINYTNHTCLAIAYHRLGRIAQADEQRAKVFSDIGESGSYQMAQIYAQWGNPTVALDWLETGYRVHDSGIMLLRVDEFMDPLRKESRFQEIERKLNFPS